MDDTCKEESNTPPPVPSPNHLLLGVDESVPPGSAEELDGALLHVVLDAAGHGVGARATGNDEVGDSEPLRDGGPDAVGRLGGGVHAVLFAAPSRWRRQRIRRYCCFVLNWTWGREKKKSA